MDLLDPLDQKEREVYRANLDLRVKAAQVWQAPADVQETQDLAAHLANRVDPGVLDLRAHPEPQHLLPTWGPCCQRWVRRWTG